MNKNPFTMVELIVVVIIIALIVAWPVNLFRLIGCDFSSNTSWKPEIVHAVGVFVPPAAVITVWYETD